MVNRGGSDRRYFCGTLTAPDQVNVDPASYSTHKTDLAIGRLSYDFGPVTLRYTGSWAKYQAFALQDQHLNTFGGTLPTASRRFTQPFLGPVREWNSELRLDSIGHSFLPWAFRGYFYSRKATPHTQSGMVSDQPTPGHSRLG